MDSYFSLKKSTEVPRRSGPRTFFFMTYSSRCLGKANLISLSILLISFCLLMRSKACSFVSPGRSLMPSVLTLSSQMLSPAISTSLMIYSAAFFGDVGFYFKPGEPPVPKLKEGTLRIDSLRSPGEETDFSVSKFSRSFFERLTSLAFLFC